MSTRQPQPPGGGTVELGTLQAAMSEASIIIHNPPDFPSNSEVLGICVVSEENANQNKYGWIVADFMRFKALFNHFGKKTSQAWLSSLDISKFLKDNGAYHQEAENDWIPKVLGVKGDHITSVPTENKACADFLFGYIDARAKVADKQGTTLVIMIFAPVTPEQDICIDFNPTGRKAYLITDRVREVIREAVGHERLPVVLVTPSPFTGGWMCNPSLFIKPHGTADDLITIISKSCGATFADKLINDYTKKSCPLLSPSERSLVKYENMMPLWASDLQLSLFHKFHRKIHETLEQRMCDLSRKHSFTFDPKTDDWLAYAPRKGDSLGNWSSKWNASKDLPVAGVDRFDFLGQAFGGTRISQVFHIKYLVGIELDTCHRDWVTFVTGSTKDLFSQFLLNEKPDSDTIKRVFDTIEFRASSMTLAQMLVKGLGLPTPDGRRCRYWTDNSNDSKNYKVAFAAIHNLFDRAAMIPGENRHEYSHVRFLRPSQWLATSISIRFADASDDQVSAFIQKKVAPFMNRIRDTQSDLLSRDREIRQLGSDWLASLKLDFPLPLGVQVPTTRAMLPKSPEITSAILLAQSGVESAPTTRAAVSDKGPMSEKSRPETETADNEGIINKPLDNRRERMNVSDHSIEAEASSIKKTLVKKPTNLPPSEPIEKQEWKHEAMKREFPVVAPVKPTSQTVVQAPDKSTIASSSGRIAEPATKTITQPLAKPVIPSVVKPAVQQRVPGTITKFAEGSVKSFEEPVKAPLADITTMPSKNRIKNPVEPVGKVIDNDSSTSAHGPASSMPPKVSGSDLANLDLATLLQSNPAFLAQVMAKAMELLKLEASKEENAAAASSSVAPISTSATVKSGKENAAFSRVGEGVVSEGPGQAAGSSIPLVKVSPAASGGNPGLDPGNAKLQEANPVVLVSPTPPQTPINGRGAGLSQVGNRAAGQKSTPASDGKRTIHPGNSTNNRKLAGAEDFWKHVRW